MRVSRQSAQRLVALAMQERLVKFRLDHPIAHCMDLAERLKDRYGLTYCEVALAIQVRTTRPLGSPRSPPTRWRRYSADQPVVMALGTGREIRGAVEQMSPMRCPHLQVVSLSGNLAPDGSPVQRRDHADRRHGPGASLSHGCSGDRDVKARTGRSVLSGSDPQQHRTGRRARTSRLSA